MLETRAQGLLCFYQRGESERLLQCGVPGFSLFPTSPLSRVQEDVLLASSPGPCSRGLEVVTLKVLIAAGPRERPGKLGLGLAAPWLAGVGHGESPQPHLWLAAAGFQHMVFKVWASSVSHACARFCTVPFLQVKHPFSLAPHTGMVI